jgi:mannose-6-phosphate isomerase
MDKQKMIKEIEEWIINKGLMIAKKDIERPWGAFWNIHPATLPKYLKLFFSERSLPTNQFLSPKLILVEPHQRLSLQKHYKRSELWKILLGPVRITLSDNTKLYDIGDHVEIPLETEHRLIGLQTLCIVAEIWIHQDILNPSTEEDILRLEDDYNR